MEGHAVIAGSGILHTQYKDFVHLDDGAIRCPGHYENLYKGWNLLGWTGSNVKAGDLLNNSSASMISVYNSHTGSFQSYYAGAKAQKDFTLTSGEGFFLLSEKDGVQQIYIG